ncbi:putative disease resistance protein RGA1 [Syzygium oleosum]|uniref:putative disease resistance protein RGA1 n=1 Tax=Syzygium oleosum TaxID=219896 RepID=UPI0024BB9973|nr:putative disease resistance protein RGA1 [Syzygium oleosum]
MAEAVIVGIAGKIVANLVPEAIEKVGMLWGVKHELKALGDTISTLQVVLDHAEEQYHQSPQIQVWVDKLKEAFYDAQDVLEEFNIEAMRRELRGHNEMLKEVRTFFSSSNQLAFKVKMSYKLRAVRERIEAIKAYKKFHLDERPKRDWRKREETHSFIREGDIKGRDDDKRTVIKFLLDSNVKENVSILPIVGIGGLGKTALAQCVYNDEMVSKHFHLKLWVCVSNDFDMNKIVKNIIARAKNKELTEVAIEQLQSELRTVIDGKRYLLVLDDVWITERETWLKLKTLLMGGAGGSKILITTRLPLVAEITRTAPPHYLRDLSDSASLDLLMQMACRKEEKIQDPEMLAIGKDIVRKCYGVPLVVRTVGSILFFKKTKPEWSHFKDYELPDVSQREEGIKSILRLSYDHLPSHLKQCFAFCSLFPKDYKIKKQTLVDLWMAEGFIQQSNRSQHLEDIAHGYFMDLLWSNFFQDFEKDPDTNEKTCKMHDLMHDLACLVAGIECWVAWDDRKSIPKRTRHISYGSTFNLMGELPISRIQASALRTFLGAASDREMEPMSEANLRQLIQSFKRLRVLDLHTTYVEKVSKSIWQLSSLHRLTRFILPKDKALAKDCCGLGELKELNNIRGSLCIENLGSVTDAVAESRAANLRGKHSLESLILEWGDFDTDDVVIMDSDEALLGGLWPHSNLQELMIRGYKGESFPRWMMDSLVSSLPNLVEVGFSSCRRCKHLPPLGQLPRLKSLSIWELPELEDIGLGHSSTSIASFPSLLKLKIISCMKLKAMAPAPHLEELILSNANPALINMIVGLNKLKSLNIRMMESLECVPEECWKSLTSLESLQIWGCTRLTSLSTAPPLGTRHQSNLVDLDSSDSEELDLSNYDESNRNNNLILELHSLRSVSLGELPKLASLPQWLLQLSNLERLNIQDCKELDLCKDESSSNNVILDFHGGLHQSLRSLWIDDLPKLASLPQWLLQASNLEHLEISRCFNLKELPEQIEALQSLQRLDIHDSPSLTSLPEGMRKLASLTHLRIYGCPELKKRCKRDAGEDWYKIAHIPDIYIG